MPRDESTGTTGHGTGHALEHDGVLLPAPTAWPMVLALGVALIITGMVTHWVISLLGVVLAVRSTIGWFLEVLPHERHVPVPIEHEELAFSSPRATHAKSPIAANHRKLIPVETFSITAGIKGGIVGGIAMVVPATIFSVLRYHSLWYAVNLLAAGGFGGAIGRFGQSLLSDEEVQLAWMLQDAGYSVRYDSRITVFHQIQARRMKPEWLLSRLYWQGASTVLTRRLLQQADAVWRELPRRLLVACLLAPAGLIPRRSTFLLSARWRLAYAYGFIKATFGWHATAAAIEQAAVPVAA